MPLERANGSATLGDAKRMAELTKWVGERYKAAKADRTRLERQWYLNLAFYAGRQNVEFVRAQTVALGVRLRVPAAPPWRVRQVVNRLRPMVRKEIAKLTSNKPAFDVVPATNEDEDQAAARVGEQLLGSLYDDLKIDEQLRDAVWWLALTGTSFLKDYWDPGAGKPDPQTGAPPGEICVKAVDPFHLFVPDLRERSIDGQPWVIHAATRPRDWVTQTFGQNVNDKSLVASTEQIMEDVLFDGSSPRPTKQVLVLECWVNPGAHRALPNGGMLTVVGDQVAVFHDGAQSGDVYSYCELPFTKFEHIPMGRFYGDSSLTDLVPLQREYNRIRSQVMESRNLMSKLKWTAMEGSVDADKITSEPGQVIFYKFGMPAPQPVQPATIPGYVMQEMEQVRTDLDDVSGQHQISRGFAPSHTAASAIAYLQEQDDTLLAYTTASLEDGMARVGRHLLSHVTQFWSAPRTIKTVGANGAFDTMMFTASMLRGNTDVRVQAGSALPSSKAARAAVVMDMFKMGGLGPPGDPEANRKLWEIMDMPGAMDKALEDYQVDARQAHRENVKMLMGVPTPVNPYDNHAMHITLHNRERKGQQFEASPDPIKQMFAEHVFEHEKALVQAQQIAGSIGAAPGGPPGGPGTPPGQPPGASSGGPPPGGPPGP